MTRLILVVALVSAMVVAPTSVFAQAAPHCPPGQAPEFVLGIADLKERVGAPMGQPIECEHPDMASGDTHQRTTTGLAYFRPSTGTIGFTDGWKHWALTPDGLRTWEGTSAEPPPLPAPPPPSAPSAPAAAPSGSPTVLHGVNLPGRITGGFNARSYPRVAPSTLIRFLPHNTPVWVEAAVRGADGDTWYRVSGGRYVHSSGVRLPRTPPRTYSGRWIDADLNLPAMVTAYEGSTPVYSALAIPGVASSQTPTGFFRIARRVYNETMNSETIGIPRNSPDGYYLEDVLFTQYFTSGGAALHYNYWKGTFGYPGSHGCLGLNYADSEWFWNWASIGTPVVIRR